MEQMEILSQFFWLTTGTGRGYKLRVSPSGLAVACTKFPLEVQINLILKACSSGAFSKTFRVLSEASPIIVSTAFSKDKAGKSYSDQRSVSEPLRNSPFGGSVCEDSWINEGPRWDLDGRKTRRRSSRLTWAVLWFLSRVCFRFRNQKADEGHSESPSFFKSLPQASRHQCNHVLPAGMILEWRNGIH